MLRYGVLGAVFAAACSSPAPVIVVASPRAEPTAVAPADASVVTATAATAATDAAVTAAIDLTTGKEAWRTELAASGPRNGSDISSDNRTCLLASESDPLRVVDCARGTALWTSDGAPPGDNFLIAGFVRGHAIYELRDARATLFDERTGKQRWRVTLPAKTIGWPRGAELQLDWRYADATAIALLDPATGRTLATIPHAKDATIALDRAGGVYLAGERIEHYAASGKLVGQAAIATGSVVVGTAYVLAATPAEVVVLAADDLHEIGRISGHYQDAMLEGELGDRRASVFEYDAQSPGRVLLLQLGR